MKATLERETRRMWLGEGGIVPGVLALLWTPLAVLFGSAVRLRGFLYDRGWLPARRSDIPVISVGNLAVGGTGKTPFAAWLAAALERRGWHPAVVLRGYGEDEVLLHRRWNPAIPVIADPDRVAGVAAAAKAGANIAILDDGFQHRRLARDLDLVLLSPAQPLPPRLLPRGPFREPVGALRRADRVIVTAKGPEELAQARALADGLAALPGTPPVVLFPLRAGDWCSLTGAASPAPAGRPLVVTSVAAPEAFRSTVEGRIGGPLEHLDFGDHHDFTQLDAIAIREKAAGMWVVTTEKDAVKLTSFGELLPEVRVLPLVPEPPAGFEEDLIGALGDRLRLGDRS